MLNLNTLSMKGFTLIELLIAITIMAFIAIISYTTLDGMLRSQQQLEQKDEILRQIQRTHSQWQIDCQHLEVNNIPSFSNTFQIITKETSSNHIQGLWLIRRNTENQVSTWQLIKYLQYKNYLYRIAFNNTNNANQLMQDINRTIDFNNIDSLDNFLIQSPNENIINPVKMLQITQEKALNLNIWNNKAWHNYKFIKQSITNIKGLQLKIKLDNTWQDLGLTQTFNCLTMKNL